MRRIMGISLSLIALLAVAAIAFVALQGARLFTPHLEAAASRALARPVAIEGSLALRWSPAPSLVVEGLRIGDGQDATSADLLRIGRLEVRPALGPLLRGKIELHEVSLADATIAAALFTRAPPGQTEPTGNSGSGGRGALVPRIGILRAERLRLELPRLEGGSPRRVEITRLEASVSDQNDRMELDASGILEGTEWTLRFGLTPLSGLVTRASVELEPFALRLGEDDLEGKLALELGGPRPRLSGRLQSRHLAPLRLAALLSGGQTAPAPRAEQDEPRFLIPDRTLDVTALRGIELALELVVEKLQLNGAALQWVRAPLELANARLTLPLSAQFAGGTVKGRLALDAGAPESALELDLALKGVAVSELERALGQPVSIEAPLDLALEVAGHGRTIRTLVGSLDGRLTAALGRGRIALAALDRLAGGVRELVLELVSERRGEWVPLRCAVVDLPLRAGVVETRTAVLETEAARLIAEGRIDLATERLDLTLVPRARAATLTFIVPVRVRGTLAQPRFALDQREAARRAALGLLGALVFPPAALAAFAELGVSDNPCLAPVAGAGQKPAEGPPALPGADVLRRGLEGLFGR